MGETAETHLENEKKHYRVSQHLANERTHLAYVRTAVALISFGITINRFSLYLLQQQVLPEFKEGGILRDAERIGFGMVVFGVLLAALAAFRYVKVDHAIEQGEFRPHRAVPLIVAVAVVITGVFSVFWLFIR